MKKGALRNVFAVIGGILVGMVLIAVLEGINRFLYPMPKDLDVRDAVAFKAYYAALPAGALLVVLGAYFGGFLAGIYLAARLSATFPLRQAAIVAAFFTAASLANLMGLPHPIWFWVANFAVLGFCLWFGARLAKAELPKAA